MQIVIKRLFPFLLAILFFLPLTCIPKGDIVLTINSLRTSFLDVFFIRSSSLGNAICVPFVLLLVLRFRLKWLAIFLLAFGIQVVLVLLFKKGLFAGELRPLLFFRELGMEDSLHLVEGVKIRYVNTFPSGHTATIFFLVSFFSLLSRNQTASWILLVLGLCVGFSRIYLVQHFFIDVYFGIIIGILSSTIAYLIIKNCPKSWHARQVRINLRSIQESTQNALRQLFNE